MDFFGWQDKQLEDLRLVAFSYLKQGKYDIAATFFETLTILNPKNAYDWQTLGSIYLETKKQEKALPCFEEALKIDPDYFLAQLNQAKALVALDPAKAYQLADSLRSCSDPTVAEHAKMLYQMLEKAS